LTAGEWINVHEHHRIGIAENRWMAKAHLACPGGDSGANPTVIAGRASPASGVRERQIRE
jgi:hypothetical protein